MAAEAPLADLCPNCGRGPITDDVTGWCSQCADNHTVESYWEKDAKAIEVRRGDWRVRSQSAAALRERQRRRRLREAVRPERAATRFDDPWELGKAALDCIKILRSALPSTATPSARHAADEAQVLVKLLAWGPLEDSSRTDA